MKFPKNAAFCLVIALSTSLPSVALADQTHAEQERAFVKLLDDSASSLQSADPELAGRLTAFAREEAKEIDEEKAGKKEAEEKDEAKVKERRESHMKLLNDAAGALSASHAELSSPLKERAGKIEEKLKAEEKEDENEKEEK
jgi:hypothetical protein